MRFKGNVSSVWNERTQSSIQFVDGIAEVSTQGEIDFMTRCGFAPVSEEKPGKTPKKPGKK